jgi:hypothetical protein
MAATTAVSEDLYTPFLVTGHLVLYQPVGPERSVLKSASCFVKARAQSNAQLSRHDLGSVSSLHTTDLERSMSASQGYRILINEGNE